MRVKHDVPLAPRTTLQIGGAAARLVDVETEADVVDAVALATDTGSSLLVLGGGSNLVVGDDGYAGLVAKMDLRGVAATREGGRVLVDVAAGEAWDPFVERCAAEGWSGVECLAGIPGLVGATPIQNVGAYGQEVADTIVHVRAFDRHARAFVELPRDACAFGYRHSLFKSDERFIVVAVRFALALDAQAQPIRYAELARTLGIASGERAPLDDVRRTVVALRREKGMVLDPADPDSVSAGSFFTNPILAPHEVTALDARLASVGLSTPRFPVDGGGVKLSAGWLIEHAGFTRGYGAGRVGVSRKHALALVNRGGATARELLALAREIRDGVRARFGVTLVPEPVLVGAIW